ncbi:MAG: hypothetical protein MESAZ_03031 [Saezia sanguinis]
MLSHLPLIFFLMAFVGVLVFAIISFVRTSSEERYKLAFSRRDERLLQAQLASGDAVEIAPQPRRAILKVIPWVMLMVPFLAFGMYLSRLADSQCAELFGLPVSYLNLLMLFYGWPFLFLLVALFGLLPFGLNVLKHGYLPPLDSVVFRRTIAQRGAISRLRGAAWLLLALAALPFAIYAHVAFVDISGDASHIELIQKIRDKCIHEPSR